MKVELTYFKETGKYYSTGEYDTSREFLHQIWDEVRDMLNRGIPMPGLIGTWHGPISIDVPSHEHRHPRLVNLGAKGPNYEQ